MIDATAEQKEAYAFLVDAFTAIREAIKPGAKVCEVYKACQSCLNEKAGKLGSEIGERYKSYISLLPKVLGYGIGM
jgi:Xaa-Pro aminopeptidase